MWYAGKGRPDSELNADQREQKLTSVPGIVQYFTFLFSFHLFLTGPVCTIREFQNFMAGTNFSSHPPPDVRKPCICLVPVIVTLKGCMSFLVYLLHEELTLY